MLSTAVCRRCGAEKKSTEFFSAAAGTEYEGVCKDCVSDGMDIRDFGSVRKVLRVLDVPFVEPMWAETANKAIGQGRASAKMVLGRYLRLMNMRQYKGFGYGDADALAAEWAKNHDMGVEIDDELFERGVRSISESALGDMNDNDLRLYRSLSPKDVDYLVGKWGSEYLPSEWVQMESMYAGYADEYELNVDRAQTLVFMCKTTVRMNQMLAQGDIADYQRLAGVLKDLRASGKFTEAQRVEKRRYLDSVGELVAFCEKEGGIIPQHPDPDEFPQDKVDFTIRDLKAYTYNLVANEMGLGSVIETYIKKLEEAESDTSLDDARFVTSGEEADEEYMNDVTAEEWQTYLESGIDDEIDDMLREVRS